MQKKIAFIGRRGVGKTLAAAVVATISDARRFSWTDSIKASTMEDPIYADS